MVEVDPIGSSWKLAYENVEVFSVQVDMIDGRMTGKQKVVSLWKRIGMIKVLATFS